MLKKKKNFLIATRRKRKEEENTEFLESRAGHAITGNIKTRIWRKEKAKAPL